MISQMCTAKVDEQYNKTKENEQIEDADTKEHGREEGFSLVKDIRNQLTK